MPLNLKCPLRTGKSILFDYNEHAKISCAFLYGPDQNWFSKLHNKPDWIQRIAIRGMFDENGMEKEEQLIGPFHLYDPLFKRILPIEFPTQVFQNPGRQDKVSKPFDIIKFFHRNYL